MKPKRNHAANGSRTRLSAAAKQAPARPDAARRRAVLRSLSGSALLAAVSERLPGGWRRPLIDAAALPAHAQSSGINTPQSRAPAHLPGATIPPLPGLARGEHRREAPAFATAPAPTGEPATTGAAMRINFAAPYAYRVHEGDEPIWLTISGENINYADGIRKQGIPALSLNW